MLSNKLGRGYPAIALAILAFLLLVLVATRFPGVKRTIVDIVGAAIHGTPVNTSMP